MKRQIWRICASITLVGALSGRELNSFLVPDLVFSFLLFFQFLFFYFVLDTLILVYTLDVRGFYLAFFSLIMAWIGSIFIAYRHYAG